MSVTVHALYALNCYSNHPYGHFASEVMLLLCILQVMYFVSIMLQLHTIVSHHLKLHSQLHIRGQGLSGC